MAGRKTPRMRQKGETSLRRCIVSGAEMSKDRMVRFVIGPDDEIVADVEARLPGRGFWLSAERDMIHTACAKNLFAKAARANVTIPADLADRVEGLLAKRCLNHVGLARRAGEAVSGFAKVEAWLKTGKPAGVLLAAADGAEDGLAKVRAWAQVTPVIAALDANELGQAFARERAVHVIVAPGRLAKNLLVDAGRLEGLRKTGAKTPRGDARRS
ncbi:MAG: RNA-binding protein [Rhodospirillaceae bacterium]|nr:RNA-binding protein [Rhodospirillaceae bacterium]